MIPERLAHYRILERLGAGGMGEVYLAEDTKLGRSVAIKILPPELAGDPDRLDRFIREARAASAINHPNVAHIYEIGTAAGLHYIAMEPVEGEALSAKVASGKSIELSEILDWGIQMADALDEAHQRGIVHRDIKPGNVLVTAKGQIKVLDFGLAKMRREKGVEIESSAPTEAKTKTGLVMGTVSYMSPEQAFGRDVDTRSDLFSLGVLLYELTTGRLPHKGDSFTETIDRIAHAKPEPIARFRRGMGNEIDELDRIVRKLLEKSPADRYQSARELLVDLRNLKRDSESGASVRVATPRRLRPLVWLGTAAVIAVAIAGAYFLLPSDRIDSVAVLPFENDSADPDAEYLSDGITGNIIVSLSRLPNVRVISRNTAFRYKGKTVDPEALGSELDVDAVVLGRVALRGDDLSLTAEAGRNRRWKPFVERGVFQEASRRDGPAGAAGARNFSGAHGASHGGRRVAPGTARNRERRSVSGVSPGKTSHRHPHRR